MKQSLFFKQSKPITVKILGGFILLLTLALIYEGVAKSNQIIIMLVIGVVLLGYSISFELCNNFNNFKHFKLFGLSLFKQNLPSFSPNYISVFSASYKKGSEWGPVAAIGKHSINKEYVIRLFNQNNHFTVFRSNSLEKATTKATKLGTMLKVEVKINE
ncbi:hypothetical protein [Flagellimonas eckloniae]|uniref:Uncharacterized protein n=1 Tax=Flagellimonas eckloniae TaxID=346185 RepID=A0A0Q1BJ21_9FLAO|nr:hypothetical protein [Allomuricauda eckloniae]KQC30623.1 hypothetical protein AAY42_12615 [Allomuricauda eckloniae]